MEISKNITLFADHIEPNYHVFIIQLMGVPTPCHLHMPGIKEMVTRLLLVVKIATGNGV